MGCRSLWALLVLVTLADAQTSGKISKVYNAIYREYTGSPCVRLLNSDGVIGCGFADKTVNGPLFLMTTSEDLARLQSDDVPNTEFAVVMSSQFFDTATFQTLREKKRLNGVLLLDGPAPAGGFSPERKVPLQSISLHPESQFAWNPVGSGMSYQSFDFPIFALNQSESQDIVKLAEDNNARGFAHPRHSIEFNSWMFATDDAETCLRRQFCDPVGGRSVWASFGKPLTRDSDVVLASAALDATGFFHDITPGGDNDISGLVTLLAAAQAMQKLNESTPLEKTIVMAAFNAEAWGYYGSSIFTNDLKSFKCEKEQDGVCAQPYRPDMAFTNINLDKVVAAVDVRQVGRVKDALYIHREKSPDHSSALAQTIRDVAAASVVHGGVEAQNGVAPTAAGIPPSSLVPLLKARGDIAAVVLAEHADEFTNKYYNSKFDNSDNVDVESVCKTATVLARTLHKLAAPALPVPDDLRADCNVTKELLDCLTKDFNCALFKALRSGVETSPAVPYYSGVFQFTGASFPVAAVYDLFALFTETARGGECSTGADCPDNYACIGDVCRLSGAHYHYAHSPGLEFDYDNGGWNIIDPTYPNYVESRWAATGLRTYLEDDPTSEALILIAGIVTCAASFAIGYAMKKVYFSRFKVE